jgi:hypothetical protein
MKGEIEIFIRRGQRVFRSYSLDTPWDGTIDNADAHAGIYRYAIKYYINNSYYELVEGQITLLR